MTSARAHSFSGLDQRLGRTYPRAIGADPSETAGDFHARRSQLAADHDPARLFCEGADRSGHVDRSERRSGEVEHRYRGRADAAFEMGVAPGDAGATILLDLGMQRRERGRGVLAEALELYAGKELERFSEQHAAHGGGMRRE